MQGRVNDLRFNIAWAWRAWCERLWADSGLWVARHLPHWVRYWVTVDSIAKATSGEYSNTVVPELRAMDVLKRI